MDTQILKLEFNRNALAAWSILNSKHSQWPVVYILDDGKHATKDRPCDVYVGETSNAVARLRQHLETPSKQHLKNVYVLFNERYNKSVCLDLEACLIRALAGDGAYRVLNRNDGIVDSNYYQRDQYRAAFPHIIDKLVALGFFTKTIAAIESSDLFKLSPFKALNADQATSVTHIVQSLLSSLRSGTNSTIVVQGDPGTGKTVVAIFTLKLLVDIGGFASLEDLDDDSLFHDFFTEANQTLLSGLRLCLVVPQQSLRESIQKVFKKTPGLHQDMVKTPFEVAKAQTMFDLVMVDETHRLNQRASQASGVQNKQFKDITVELFGDDDKTKTQLDWIQTKSRHQIFLVDTAQSVRPADLPAETLLSLIDDAQLSQQYFLLQTQMRIQAGSDFVSYIRQILDPDNRFNSPARQSFDGYDFRLFDDLGAMRDEILLRDAEAGLARLVAGYAWPWKSKNDKTAVDIEIGCLQLRWNQTPLDWVASKSSLQEVGSVHVVQGYDLNYVGVIIGLDLRYNTAERRLWFSRSSYHDTRGRANNRMLGKVYSDDDVLRYVTQIYAVLLTRGIRGTYVYVCQGELREYLRGFIPTADTRVSMQE